VVTKTKEIFTEIVQAVSEDKKMAWGCMARGLAVVFTPLLGVGVGSLTGSEAGMGLGGAVGSLVSIGLILLMNEYEKRHISKS
jgi:hypothetical protein